MNQPAPAAPTGPSFSIVAQYVRDLSLENPNAPESLQVPGERPQVALGMDLAARQVRESQYETMLKLNVRATADKKTLFIVELTYAALVQAQGFTPEQMEQVLLVDVPFVIFPFARRVVADATHDAGFPPVLFEPIDFRAHFIQRKQQGEKPAA